MVRIQIILSSFLLLLILLSDEREKFALTSHTFLEISRLVPLSPSNCFVRKCVYFGVLCTLNITDCGIELLYGRMVSTYPNVL